MGGIQSHENKKDTISLSKNQFQNTLKVETSTTKPKLPTCSYTITWQDTKPPQRIGKAYSPFDTEETEDICQNDDSSKDQSVIRAQSIQHSENSSTTIKNILKNLSLSSPNHTTQDSNAVSIKHFKSARRNKKISMEELEALF